MREDDADTWVVPASTGPYAAHGSGDPRARIFRRRGESPWEPVTDELTSMAYAPTWRERLYAGLADGSVWGSDAAGAAAPITALLAT